MAGKTSDMHKRAFQALKGTFMDVSSLPTPDFDLKKTKCFINLFFYQNMVGKDLRHAYTCVSGPETHVYACLRSGHPPPFFDLKKLIYKVFVFYQNMVGEDLRHA